MEEIIARLIDSAFSGDFANEFWNSRDELVSVFWAESIGSEVILKIATAKGARVFQGCGNRRIGATHMAKLGRTTARWEGIASGIRREYALRRDGVLLRKTTHLNKDGSVDFSDGWVIETRKPKQNVGDILCRQGFQRIYS